MEAELTISKDTTIADILANNPDKARLLSEIMIEFGIHCVGCGAAAFETLEQGVLGHGFSEKDLNSLITDLNKAISGEEIVVETSVPENFTIKLSDIAIKKVKDIMKAENKEGEILRVSVLAGGCSGYTYDLEVIPQAQKSDIIMRQDNVQIAVDKESTEFLNNTIIDFIDTLNESGFKFNNPNATKECGCGKSFS